MKRRRFLQLLGGAIGAAVAAPTLLANSRGEAPDLFRPAGLNASEALFLDVEAEVRRDLARQIALSMDQAILNGAPGEPRPTAFEARLLGGARSGEIHRVPMLSCRLCNGRGAVTPLADCDGCNGLGIIPPPSLVTVVPALTPATLAWAREVSPEFREDASPGVETYDHLPARGVQTAFWKPLYVASGLLTPAGAEAVRNWRSGRPAGGGKPLAPEDGGV